MTESAGTTDKRVDDLRSEVRGRFDRVEAEMHRGFKRVDAEMHRGFKRVDADMREVRSDIGSLQRLMIGFFATTLGSIVGGVILLLASHH